MLNPSLPWTMRDTVLTTLLGIMAAAICLPTSPIVGWDNSWYIVHGLNILIGNGYTGADLSPDIPARGPLLPAIIAVGLSGGINSVAALLPIRVLAVANVILLFLLGRRLDSRLAGALAAVLYFASGSASMGTVRIIDLSWTTFFLAGLLLLPLTAHNARILPAIGSGVFFGLAYLVKETAILAFPLPLLIWALVPDMRNRKGFALAAVTCATAALAPLGWTIYRALQTQGSTILGVQGAAVPEYILQRLFGSPWSPAHFLNTLIQVFQRLCIDAYALSLVPVLGLAALAFCGRKRPALRMPVLAALCLAPLGIYVGLREWTAAYLYPFYLLGYLACGILLACGTSCVQGRQSLRYGILLVVTTPLLIGQLFMPPHPADSEEQPLSRADFVYEYSRWRNTSKAEDCLDGTLYPGLLQAIQKANRNNEPVMTDDGNVGNWLFFNSQGRIRTSFYPWIVCHGAFRSQTRYTGPVPGKELPAFLNIAGHTPHVVTRLAFDSLVLTKARQDHVRLFVSTTGSMRRHLKTQPWAVPTASGTTWWIWTLRPEKAPIQQPFPKQHAAQLRDWYDELNANALEKEHTINEIGICLGGCFDEQRLAQWIESL